VVKYVEIGNRVSIDGQQSLSPAKQGVVNSPANAIALERNSGGSADQIASSRERKMPDAVTRSYGIILPNKDACRTDWVTVLKCCTLLQIRCTNCNKLQHNNATFCLNDNRKYH
jgi:hypothetical protein